MSSLFIAGNGFDIAHGIPSNYSEFRKYIIRNYPDALKFRNEKVCVEDYDYIIPEEFAAEILLNTMDKVNGENWEDFEAALAHIDFNNKFPRPKHKENETEEEDNSLMSNYLLYMDMLTSGFIACTEWWQYFFQNWIREVQNTIKILNYNSKISLRKLFKENDMLFFSFNYTKTLEKIYGIKDVTHIHNYVGQKLIFGHGEDNAGYGEDADLLLSSSLLDDMVMSFRKDTNFPMIKYKKFFKKLNCNVDKVYSYGFSYGKVDSVYIKKIVNNILPEAVWCFTEFETRDSESLRIKKIKLRNYGFKGTFDIYEG